MRFLSITLRRFGPFDDLTLDLSQGNHGLHVIYGDNEAGKTTALRGLGFFLFGFEHKTTDDFRFKHSEQRIGGKLRDQHGNELEALRRRGNKHTLRTADDRTPLADSQIQELLGGLSQEQFEMLFGLDHDRLRAGGEAIVAGHGGLGQALFEAGAGLAGLKRIDQTLQQQMEGLYKKQGQNQLIAVSSKKLKEERDQLRARTLQIEAWTAQEEMLRLALARQKQLEAERNRNREEMTRLEAYRSALPVIGGLQHLQGRFDAVKSARRLGKDFAQRHHQAIQHLHVAHSQLDAAQKDVERLQKDLDDLPPQNAVLIEGQAIERLKGDLGACLKAEKDRLGLYARMREHRGTARTILRAYFRSEDLDNAESFRITPAAKQRIRDLAQAKSALIKAVEDDGMRLGRFDHEIAECQQQLAACADPADVTALAALARSLEQQGPMEKNQRDATATLAVVRRKADAALQRLAPCWSGPLESAAGLPVPSADAVRHFQKRFADHEDIGRKLDDGIEKCERTIRNSEQQMQRLLGAGRVPTETQLRENREDRNLGVIQVRRSWRESSADLAAIAAFIARHAPGRDLLDALEVSILACDDIADQMRRDAQRVSDLAVQDSEKRIASQELDSLRHQLQQHARDSEELERQWADLWQPPGISPKPPSEMIGWLQQLDQVRELASDFAAAAEAVNQSGKHIDECKARLKAALGLDPLHEPTSLGQLLAVAAQKQQSVQDQKRSREDLEKRLQDLRLKRDLEEKKKQKDEERLAQWQEEWGTAVSAIALGAGDDPAMAERYFDQHDQMFADLRDAGTLEMRIRGMDRDRDQFLSSLNGLRRRLDSPAAADSTVLTMEAEVDALVSRLGVARQVEMTCKLRAANSASAQKKLQSVRERLFDLEATLATLRDEAGVTCENEIEGAVEQANERLDVETRIEEERGKLLQQARAHSLDLFIAEALAVRETLDHRLAELQDSVEPLDTRIKEQAIVAAAAKRQLDAWGQASADAANSRQEVASIVEELRDQVQEYASLHLARQALKLTIERFRQRHQGTLLERAAHFFRILTNESFTGLDVDQDDKGEQVLLAQRKTPVEQVGPAGLSDGTRDQLFLALRLAGIEQHLQDREPMPLIVDDVLIHFDQNRAKATLECLAELSVRTQVLLFTHHKYLVHLAKSALPRDLVFCHDLKPVASE